MSDRVLMSLHRYEGRLTMTASRAGEKLRTVLLNPGLPSSDQERASAVVRRVLRTIDTPQFKYGS